MSERRKLSETLTVKERQFLGQGTSPASPEREPSLEATPTEDPAIPTKKTRWVPVTTRLPEELVHQLKMTCREREDTGIEPSTRQDILSEALENWFEQN